MFKRVTWMGIGMAVGASGAFRAKRKVEATIERYLPDHVADRAAASARGVGAVVKAAAAEGREAMRATEEELRARVEARTFVGGAPVDETGTLHDTATSPAEATPRPRRVSRRPHPDVAATNKRRRSRR